MDIEAHMETRDGFSTTYFANDGRKFHGRFYRAEEGGWWGKIVELPGCASQGDTVKEAVANLKEALTGVLEASEAEK